jgi:tRNA(His) 5'-end guanylyltransferase
MKLVPVTKVAIESSKIAVGYNRTLCEELGNKVKLWESEYNKTLSPLEPFVIRLDGSSFKKFTSSFNKPFDMRLSCAMIYTAMDLLREFRPTFAFVQSDEISLLFPICPPKSSIVYGGRLQKLVSLTAAYGSVRFNLHIQQLFKDSMPGLDLNHPTEFEKKADGKLLKTFRSVYSSNVTFDSRIVGVPTYHDMWECKKHVFVVI